MAIKGRTWRRLENHRESERKQDIKFQVKSLKGYGKVERKKRENKKSKMIYQVCIISCI